MTYLAPGFCKSLWSYRPGVCKSLWSFRPGVCKSMWSYRSGVLSLNTVEAVIETKFWEISDNRVFVNVEIFNKLNANFSGDAWTPLQAKGSISYEKISRAGTILDPFEEAPTDGYQMSLADDRVSTTGGSLFLCPGRLGPRLGGSLYSEV